MAGVIRNLSNVRNPVAGAVIIMVTMALSSIIIVGIIALSFGSAIDEGTKVALVGLISTGGSLLFGGFMLLARGAGSVTNSVYYPVKADDFGIPKI